MIRLLTLALALTATTAMAQTTATSDYDVLKDEQTGADIYKGACTFADLQKNSNFKWFDAGVKNYKPNAEAISYLKKNLGGYEMVVLMGTWCDDSQQQIPRLYKVLKESGYPMEKVAMYGMDRNKQAKNVEHKIYQVDRLPTIALYKAHMQAGRIVETPKKSIEEDLAEMVKAQVDAAGK